MQRKLWKVLESERTVMLGIPGDEAGLPRPMTAQIEGERGPVWFFAGRPNSLVDMADGRGTQMVVVSKGHDLFATVNGTLSLHNDPATIERLWNPFIAAWFEGGKDDPKLRLLRMDPEDAHVWLNENSLLAGVKLMLGVDPKKAYEDKTGDIKIA